VDQLITRTVYLLATAFLLAYWRLYQEHGRCRLELLAHWRPAESKDRRDTIAAALEQAAAVLDARSALAQWRTEGGPWEAALWRDDRCAILETSPHPPIIVPTALERATFSRSAAAPDRLDLGGSTVLHASEALKGELVTSLPITAVSSAPLEGMGIRGRLFLIDNAHAGDDTLAVTRIVADRVSAELDRQTYSGHSAERFALREREAIARDLHDGLLQNLTAVRAQLGALQTDNGTAAGSLQAARDLLRIEQHRIRRYVDLMRSANSEESPLDALRPTLEEAARTWGCNLLLEFVPASAMLSRKLLNQLSLMLSEAIANAVRHGHARAIEIVIWRGANTQIKVRDDGHGFPAAAGSHHPHDVADDNLPRSLHSRALDLGGQLRISTSSSGTEVYFDLPS
jgi:signal transduction histidine kinase